ncbi:MAG: alpha-glucosidase/alpha-galactosidase, partial [Rhodobiaceae bacterium]
MFDMPKITFIGAGSTIFLRHLLGDALLMPSLSNAEIALMDIDEQRLAESELVARRVVETLKAGASVTATTSRREALDGADFVIVSVQIGGYKPCTVTDFEIPKKYGLRQTIADTLGIGGIMRGLRTVPFLWDLCADMEELCPDAVMLQYVNPMAINCWAIRERFPNIRTVGLCHSVPNTLFELTHDLDIPMADVRYRVAGINHVAFFLNFEQRVDGGWRDLYP